MQILNWICRSYFLFFCQTSYYNVIYSFKFEYVRKNWLWMDSSDSCIINWNIVWVSLWRKKWIIFIIRKKIRSETSVKFHTRCNFLPFLRDWGMIWKQLWIRLISSTSMNLWVAKSLERKTPRMIWKFTKKTPQLKN